MRRRVLLFLLAVALGCARSPSSDSPGEPSARLRWERGGSHGLSLDGAQLGRLSPRPAGWQLTAPGVDAELRVREAPQGSAHRYPLQVTTTAFLDRRPVFADVYTLLAPAAPLPVEGLGLVVASDEPGTNDAEHAALRAWLGEQGLPADTRPFQALHEQETGRELRVWYEISGRRRDARFSRVDGDGALARNHALFRSEGGALKIHHRRPGENGRFTYHRESLERAAALHRGEGPALVSHECGCYGYAIAADYMTLGDSLYHVVADWLDDRVAAEFFVGLEFRDAFPWVGVGDRRRMRDLARRARAWELTDAEGNLFAEVALDLPDDPPPGELGAIDYRIDEIVEGARRPLARVRHTAEAVEIDLFGEDGEAALERLDRLLAAMPTQVERGDGVRDSHLAEIELVVDALRLLREPGENHLADFASPVDAWTALDKVRLLLAESPGRFAASEQALPPPPMAVAAGSVQLGSVLGGTQ